MRLLVLGAGAVGGYFGGRLVQAGAADVTFLVRPGRLAQLQTAGLVVESTLGDIAVPIAAVTHTDIRGPYDLVLLTAKAYDLDGAIEAIGPAVGPATGVIPLLNGIAHIERLNAVFGRERVLGGIAKIAITVLPDGRIKHLNDWCTIIFGEQGGALSPRVRDLHAAFARTQGVKAIMAEDIEHQLWEKLVHLATVAGMSTLMRANVGEIVRAPGGLDIMQTFLERNAAIAAAAGHPMTAEFMAQYRQMFADPAAPYAASMLRDIERKGPVEADHIIGYMLEAARRYGIDATLHRISFAHLKAYENRRAAGRL
jgi:2-dehydropantoate 2-reductase